MADRVPKNANALKACPVILALVAAYVNVHRAAKGSDARKHAILVISDITADKNAHVRRKMPLGATPALVNAYVRRASLATIAAALAQLVFTE